MSDGQTDRRGQEPEPVRVTGVQQPTVGRIVFYTSHTSNGDRMQSPAIVTGISADDDLGTPGLSRIYLTVFPASESPFHVSYVEYSPDRVNGHWSWPPRV